MEEKDQRTEKMLASFVEKVMKVNWLKMMHLFKS